MPAVLIGNNCRRVRFRTSSAEQKGTTWAERKRVPTIALLASHYRKKLPKHALLDQSICWTAGRTWAAKPGAATETATASVIHRCRREFASYVACHRNFGQRNFAGVMSVTGRSQWASRISKRRCSSRL